MLSEHLLFILRTSNIVEEKKIFHLVFTESQMYGPRHTWANFQIFMETLFICNYIGKNLNQNFQSQLSYHSFKLLFLFFQNCALSSSKKFEKMAQGRVPSPI